MYKSDIVRKVARDTRQPQRVVADVLNASHKTIQTALKDGQTVTFPGFGAYYTRERQPSKVRDIRTGKVREIPKMRVAAFRVGALLKQAVRRNKPGRKKNRLLPNLLGK